MKKVKIALTVIALLGTVGGVLALKSVRVGKFCTAATVNGVCPANLKCETGADMKGAPNAVPKCYMVTYTTANCSIDKPTCLLTFNYQPNLNKIDFIYKAFFQYIAGICVGFAIEVRCGNVQLEVA